MISLEKTTNHGGLTLQEKVAFLKRPEVYPEETGLVETRETHMSWVFLTDCFVYKMKKPVQYDVLDYSTLAARKHFCAEEIRLNRRLAGGVYLEVVPLAVDQAGRPYLGGAGTVAEWLVKMKRLPQERMLDCAIKNRTVTTEEIRAVISHLARFYRDAVPVPMTSGRYVERLKNRTAENRRALTLPKYGLPDGQVAGIHEAQLALLARSPEIFAARAAGGRIVEAHGDLRPEHVCLGPEPVIIDCLEFEPDFRILDPVEELAFLAMECELLEAPEISQLIFEVYRETAADRPPEALTDYYQSYRACVRAKLALWHIAEVNAHDADYWRSRARAYLSLAAKYLARP
jgi:aminoglycoside phosphotransferase family enzyme